ncbi:VOC family protein [Pseudohalioglobus sediminis]|uniref:VOC family protein n=1 Tax=Pseudohalioglobus sediminis TaxID=2606449 RepID=A0A5B0X6Y5_9GAMM|nr:VOC family protein [Pseudohalioglobus sediminis]KAA1193999.1 VOC family protein [Pseudohalioglobus sediminis]
MSSPTDHLVFATNDLKEGIEQIEDLLALPATIGGRHPDMGTCNAHVALGPYCYIEIIAPDPERPDFEGVRPFGIGQHETSQLVAWAARREKLTQFVESVRARGCHLSEPFPMSRITPEGETIGWELSFQAEADQDGVNVLPFFIDWGSTAHPASRCKQGATLLAVKLEHPEPEELAKTAEVLELDVVVGLGSSPRIIAQISSPRGEVMLS